MPTYKDIVAEQVFYFKNESFASLTIVNGRGKGALSRGKRYTVFGEMTLGEADRKASRAGYGEGFFWASSARALDTQTL